MAQERVQVYITVQQVKRRKSPPILLNSTQSGCILSGAPPFSDKSLSPLFKMAEISAGNGRPVRFGAIEV